MSELPKDEELARAAATDGVVGEEIVEPAETPNSCRSIRFTRVKTLKIKGERVKLMAVLVMNVWPPYDLESTVLDFTVDNKERPNITLTPQPMYCEVTHHQIDAVDPQTPDTDTVAFDQTPDELPKVAEEDVMPPGLARLQKYLGAGAQPSHKSHLKTTSALN